jgi:NAD(P)H-hydrate epimerase
MKLVTIAQMRALEASAVAAGATWPGLMEQAGAGIAAVALELLGEPHGRRALVLVGPGNNGGDGLVVARHLHDAGVAVTLYLWHRRDDPQDANLWLCRERAIPAVDATSDSDGTALRQLLDQCDLAVDALLGIGARPATGELARIIATVNAAQRSAVLAVDVPTGLDADTGRAAGACIAADITVATGLLKRGLLLFPGRAFAGRLLVAPIALHQADVEMIMSELIDAELARTLLPARPDDSHKGTFGKVLVVAGSPQYPGAATLATAGAARVGAGLVTLAAGRSAMSNPGRLPEITLQPLPEAEWGALGEAAADELLTHVGNVQALLIGPGLGREKPTGEFFARLLGLDAPRHRSNIGFRIGHAPEQPAASRPTMPPIVLDADALTLLSQHEAWWERTPRTSLVLTPHPGEMKRLLGVEELPADPVQAAAEAAARWGQIVVLKGATTIVAEPEGRTRLNDGGNAALATAGTGDVLAGAIAGLLAQGLNIFDAATLGVFLHSAAGRLVREDMGDMGALASDLLMRLPRAIKALKG